MKTPAKHTASTAKYIASHAKHTASPAKHTASTAKYIASHAKHTASHAKYIVLGLGVSGKAATAYLAEGGNKVRVFDDNPTLAKKVASQNPKMVEPFTPPFKKGEVLVVSPSIATRHNPHKLVTQAQAKGCAIKSEVSLFLERNPRLKLVAITGTNGKSTATAMLAHILNQNQIPAVACGNIGIPLCAIKPNLNTVYVVELSSYQLEIAGLPYAHTALLLNITPDHLNYHGTFANYKAAKYKIFENATHRVLVEASQTSTKQKPTGKPSTAKNPTGQISTSQTPNANTSTAPKGATSYATQLKAIVAIAMSLGVPKAKGLASADNFTPLPHRRQWLGQANNVAFINDSKATNPEATMFVLEEFKSTPIFWLAGGRAKGHFDALKGKLAGVQKGFFFGECAQSLKAELGDEVSSQICEDLPTAFEAAVAQAECFGGSVGSGSLSSSSVSEKSPTGESANPTGDQSGSSHRSEFPSGGSVGGDSVGGSSTHSSPPSGGSITSQSPSVGSLGKKCAVVLSPAAASFDQWQDFSARGDAFCKLAYGYISQQKRAQNV